MVALVRTRCMIILASISFICHTESDTFVVEKTSGKKRLSVSQYKRAIGEELELLAHSLTKEMRLLAQAEDTLLTRVGELIRDEKDGVFVGSTKTLDQALNRARQLRVRTEDRYKSLLELCRFLVQGCEAESGK